MSMGGLRMRPLGGSDYEPLKDLFLANAVPEVTRHFHPFPLDAATARRLTSYAGRDRYYVGDLDGSIVALSMLRGWDGGYAVPSFGVLVDRAFTGRGIGTRLTLFTIEEARRLACPSVRLSVYETNNVAHRIYRDLGFVEESRAEVRTPFGDDDVRIVMTKEFTDECPIQLPRRDLPVSS